MACLPIYVLYHKLIHNARHHLDYFVRTGCVPGPAPESTGNCQNKMAELWEFRSLGTPGAPGAGTGRWRPTFISGFLSGVWEFEATGASPAAARPGTRCTWPPALRHRRSLSGVWGVWHPQKGLPTSSRGRKLGYKLEHHV